MKNCHEHKEVSPFRWIFQGATLDVPLVQARIVELWCESSIHPCSHLQVLSAGSMTLLTSHDATLRRVDNVNVLACAMRSVKAAHAE
jgi:hypothetical protein